VRTAEGPEAGRWGRRTLGGVKVPIGRGVAEPGGTTPSRPTWIVPPRLLTVGEEGERRASWLELFFDLVFVVAVTELSRELVLQHSPMGFLRFAALFIPVYVAWQGYMAYATRFDTDDLLFRVAYFAAMLAIAAMAVLIQDVARGVHSTEFALAYVALRSFMLALYGRAWRSVPEARALVRFYAGGYALGVAIWLVSLAFPPPGRYIVWVIAQVLELSLPPLSTRLHRRIPTSATHLPERWALFTLIVLGESVVAVAVGTSGQHWRAESVSAAVLGFAAVACVWWLYFDHQASVALRGSTMSIVVYSYAHIPLLMGLAAMSAGVRMLIDRSSQTSLGAGPSVALLGGAGLFLVSLVGTRVVTVHGQHRRGVSLKVLASALILALLAAQSMLPPLVLAGGLALILAGVVVAERLLITRSSLNPS
jgi:low temperature requirement protein LtrA